MSGGVEGLEEDDEPEYGEALPEEEEVPSKEGPRGAEDVEGFDDVPATHLADDEYDEFVAAEFDSEGREKRDPPVTAILLGLTVVILVVWLLVGP
jgi:hypothetical protein